MPQRRKDETHPQGARWKTALQRPGKQWSSSEMACPAFGQGADGDAPGQFRQCGVTFAASCFWRGVGSYLMASKLILWM
jgi:hypothetical protein